MTSLLRLRVDGREVGAAEGERLREVLGRLGVRPLGLCDEGGHRPSVSCMACLVRDAITGRYLAPCDAPVEAGMELETLGAEVEQLRRAAVELLLSEHAGDCEAPCRLACPAMIDISPALWHLAEGEGPAAAAVFLSHAPFPAILGRVCEAPCERACRRGLAGGPVSIRALERHLGDAFPDSLPSSRPAPSSGQRLAVVGAGLAGLSAAWNLLRGGHACTLLDTAEAAGAELLATYPPEILPPTVVAAEAGRVLGAGVRFEGGRQPGRDFSVCELAAEFDAVILAGSTDAAVDLPSNVFRAGRPAGREPGPARSVALGRRAADAAGRWLSGSDEVRERRFHSVLRRLRPEEWADLLASASTEPRRPPLAEGYALEEARGEAARCLRCDCRKKESCRLRTAAEALGARQSTAPSRRHARRLADHPEVLFEAGKCICCGLCIQVAEAAGEPLGLGFQGRGRNLRVAPPFGESLASALRRSAAECARVCPTGALGLRRSNP